MEKKPSYAMHQHQLDAIRHAEDQLAAGIDHVMLVSDTHAALHSMRWLASPNELRGKTNMLQAQLRAMPQKEREKFLRNCIIIAPSFENVNSDLFERIEVQLRQVLRERKMREGEGFVTDETLLASQLLAFCEGMLSCFVRSEFRYRPTVEFDVRWPLLAAQLI